MIFFFFFFFAGNTDSLGPCVLESNLSPHGLPDGLEWGLLQPRGLHFVGLSPFLASGARKCWSKDSLWVANQSVAMPSSGAVHNV